ncbi:Cysteine-rich RLK (receptor-like protein kinase) 8 [Cucumis melo var. makuwa]|uniref:Cysteine-rich RLK (Receptor-like protein kinase) 8 n=1 Tax=Cucumis melo var. makuwa TaxID=1194695 RepID=A0A5A7T6H6_CUCMM|nr:Cysteine-rich RLK (receptor-like protein kinase) 8 [Cucumis melo var. makuwa]
MFSPPSRKYFVTMDVTFCEDRPYFPISHLQGESVREESNSTFEFIEPTSTVSDIDPHPIILPTNQVPWKTSYRRNLKKEVGSPTSQPPTPVQDSEPSRHQGMENPTEPCTNNTMNENDRSDVLENVEEKKQKQKPITMKLNKVIQGNLTNVKNAFLNGDPVDEVYMSPHLALKPSLVNSQRPTDHTLFTKVFETGKIVVLIVYVNDIVLSGDDQAEISQLKQRMGNEFEIKDLGNLKCFLGMEVARSKKDISVSQRKYILNLLTETGMLGCRLVDTPIEFNYKLGITDDQVPVDKEQYQRIVGKLIYLSYTPNISFAVSVVSQFMQAPFEEHMEAVKRIMRYLKTTPGKGLMFRKIDRKTIEAYTDSDWAKFVIDRKSTSSDCTFVWSNLVTWRR